MVESAALLVDEVLPARPIRQWMLTVPSPSPGLGQLRRGSDLDRLAPESGSSQVEAGLFGYGACVLKLAFRDFCLILPGSTRLIFDSRQLAQCAPEAKYEH